jgi:hypothetical protein
MYMLQNIEKARHKQLERKAREARRRSLAAQTGRSTEEIAARELEIANARKQAPEPTPEVAKAAESAEPVEEKTDKKEKKPAASKAKKATKTTKKSATKEDKKAEEDVFDFEEDDDDLF